MIRIGLASLRQPDSVEHGVEKIIDTLDECQRRGVELVCFPETYLPGLRGFGDSLPPPNQELMEQALQQLRRGCRERKVAAIVGVEWVSENGLENRAVVVSASGRALGHQTKNQITPGGESENYVPDGQRKVFGVKGTCFGIVLCHEGWRYPETVRWAAVRGARIVFQPQVTGTEREEDLAKIAPALSHLETASDKKAQKRPGRRQWGDSFYEKAMICRAQENSIYFASVNQTMGCQNSATSLISPTGKMLQYSPYGKEDLLVADIDPSLATRRYAKRYRPELYPQ